MNPQLETLQKLSEGLLFISEADYPFEVIELSAEASTIEQQLKAIAQKDEPVKKQTLEYFFRNAIKGYPQASELKQKTTQRFQTLLQQLQAVLKEAQVYRIGDVQVDAFIIGQLEDGSYGGLRTKLIET